MDLKEKIISLCKARGPSGFEDSVVKLCCEMLSPYVDSIERDGIGNVIAYRRCGKPHAKKLMLTAHMDEIGLIVTGYEQGFLRFAPLGGVDARMLPAREVEIQTPEPIYGVIDTMPVHVLSSEQREKAVPMDQLFIDTCLTPEQVQERIPLGTPVVYSSDAFALGQRQICGKAMDDRACMAILIQVIEEVKEKALPLDICILMAVQEEVGHRGATVGSFHISPDFCIAVDVTHARTPDSKKEGTFLLGKGPALGVGPNLHRGLTRKIRETAQQQEISLQTEVMSGNTGTDAWAIQVSRQGVITGLLSLPLKYMHTPVETMQLSDGEAMVQLLAAFVQSFTGEDI